MSATRRFKVDPPLEAGTVVLREEEARHLALVLRGRGGDRVTLFDGAGREADAEVVDAGAKTATCRTRGALRHVPAPRCLVEVACAFPRAGAADDVVRVAVEAGALAIRPLVTERGVWKPDDPGEGQRPERFLRAAIAALKQSGLAWMPDILPPATPADLPIPADTLAIVGSTAPEAVPLSSLLVSRRGYARALVIVGPEGGLTRAEEEALSARGAHRARAAPGTLRVETAVVVLLSQVLAFGAQ
jgi:16S rRNA (uracil1498-N3)-methyltransferase